MTGIATTVPAQDCWTVIGRPGPGTCPELATHVVCRNCPTYAAAALRLLDRPAPAGYVREWTEHLADEPRRGAGATSPFLVFRLGTEWFALPAYVIEQVVEPRVVHALPHRRLPVKGVVSVRGELLVCVALEALLRVGDAPPADTAARGYARLVVLAGDGGRIAFQPREVLGVERYDPREIKGAPTTLARRAESHFTTGLFERGGRTIGVLDPARLLTALTRCLS